MGLDAVVPSVIAALDSPDHALYLLPMAAPYRVFVVVDRDYSEHLAELPQNGPVWIVDTPANRTAARKVWAGDPSRNCLDGITTFKFPEDSSSEDILIDELDTIGLHHGTYSANPPYTIVEVIGTALSHKIKGKFAEFGVDQFEPTALGFRAVRLLP